MLLKSTSAKKRTDTYRIKKMIKAIRVQATYLAFSIMPGLGGRNSTIRPAAHSVYKAETASH